MKGLKKNLAHSTFYHQSIKGEKKSQKVHIIETTDLGLL
jgi:hypothetical protein